MSKPRLCYVIPSLDVGGTERQLMHMIKGLSDTFTITIICTRNQGKWFTEAQSFAQVHHLKLRGGWDPRLKRKLIHHFNTFQPDIVHSFMFGFDYPINVAARAAKIPIVISSRRQLATWKKPRHIRLQNKANVLVDAIVANSHAVAEFAAQQEHKSIEDYQVILNGIDIEALQSQTPREDICQRYTIPKDKKLIGIIANFSPVKNHALFIDIAKSLLQRRDDLHFIAIGKGPLHHKFMQTLRQENLHTHFTVLTTENDLADLYTILDVQVLCSKNEGFPNVIMEGMAAGVPIVASKVGGVPELIDHGDTGWLVETPTPETYADHIQWCLDNPQECSAMTQRARDFIQQHLSLETMLEQYTMLYTSLLTKKEQG